MALPHQTAAAENRAFLERLERSLTNQKPTTEQLQRIEDLRQVAKSLALAIVGLCPSSRERSLAATHLEETVMWAVKAIALEPVTATPTV